MGLCEVEVHEAAFWDIPHQKEMCSQSKIFDKTHKKTHKSSWLWTNYRQTFYPSMHSSLLQICQNLGWVWRKDNWRRNIMLILKIIISNTYNLTIVNDNNNYSNLLFLVLLYFLSTVIWDEEGGVCETGYTTFNTILFESQCSLIIF